MADVMTPEQRSRCMAAIKGKNATSRQRQKAKREETLERLYLEITGNTHKQNATYGYKNN